MTTLRRRIEALEVATPSGPCYYCSLQQLLGDTTVLDTCPHPERITYEEALWREGVTSDGQVLIGTSGQQRR